MKDNIQKAIQKFYEIRDIPYHIPFSENEDNFDCEGKNKLLAKELEKIGIKTRERVGLIKWSNQDLPAEILKEDHKDNSSHYFIDIFDADADNYIKLDATWNQELAKAGFLIKEWDGKSSTALAFKCYKILKPNEI